MPASDSPALITARYLKSNNYTNAYEAFITEAGLDYDAGNAEKGALTLERLLEEKKAFDTANAFEKLGVQDGGAGGWGKLAPTRPTRVQGVGVSNVLSVSVEHFDKEGSVLFVSTADRKLHILDPATLAVRESLIGLQDGPILSCASLQRTFLLTASMSGQLLLSDLRGQALDKRRDHSKYIVKIAVHEAGDGSPIVATAGWDNRVHVYKPTSPSADQTTPPSLGSPVATITLPTKPESLLFTTHPEDGAPLLLLSRTDSSFAYYYTLPTSSNPEPRLLGKQNLAPHSNAWVAFTPSSLVLSPKDPSLLAVGTSSIPSMKLLIVRLLVPPYVAPANTLPTRQSLLETGPEHETQASQARAALIVADKEAAAIQVHVGTGAPQTAYSTPVVVWRPEGNGVWVNGDDGVVRGFESNSGKRMGDLKGDGGEGHEAGSKVRCLWAGKAGGEEVLVSGGFDQRCFVWKAGKNQ